MNNLMKIKSVISRPAQLFFALILLVLSDALVSQNQQYAQGLIMDLYIVESEDGASGPKGRSVATMADSTPNTIGYLEPIEIEPALGQFRDKYWGLHSHGFVKIEDSGQHSFNLMVSSDKNTKCASWLNIQDRTIVVQNLDWRSSGKNNQYGEVRLQPGIYELSVWLGCSEYNHSAAETLTLTINMRGPNDAMLKPIPNDILLREL